jgi:hypothetical protein
MSAPGLASPSTEHLLQSFWVQGEADAVHLAQEAKKQAFVCVCRDSPVEESGSSDMSGSQQDPART